MGVFFGLFGWFCFLLNYLLPQGQQPANSYAERECSVFPGSSTRRLIRQDSSELVTLNPFYRRETNANKMQFPSSGVSARCSAIKFNYRVELKPSSLHSQRDAVLYKIEIGHGSSKISCSCLFASWLHWRLKCKECWLLSPNTLADLGYRLVPPPPWGLLPPWTWRMLETSSEGSLPRLLPSSCPLELLRCGPWGGMGPGGKGGFSEQEGSHGFFCTGVWGRDVLPFRLVCFQHKWQIAYFNKKQCCLIMRFGLCYFFNV